MRTRRLAAAIGSACLVALAAAPAVAGIMSHDVSGWKVRQYFDLSYNLQQCGGETAYKINYAAQRWYRQDTTRTLGTAPLYMGQAGLTRTCSDELADRNLNKDVNPRFDGNDLWTPQYSTSVSWPYALPGSQVSVIGANQKINIRDGSGANFLGNICSRTYLYGNGTCP